MPYAPAPTPLLSYRAAGEPMLASATPVNSVHLVFGDGPGSAPVDYVWAPGEPARRIVDVAKDRGASTIVVGHHHHSMLGRLFGTDVAADVRRTADCEVVVVD